LEKDKGVILWIHVLIVRNDPNGLKGNESHLDAVAKLLTAKEAGARLEACQALGFLGEEASSKLNDIIGMLDKETVPEVAAAAIAAMTAMPKESMITIPVLTTLSRTHVSMDVRKLAEEAVKFLSNPKKN
jgi:HEAT repeat protein